MGLIRDILTLRAYARAKEEVMRAKKPDDLDDTPMVSMVFKIQAEIIQRRRRQQRTGDVRTSEDVKAGGI